MVALTGGLLLAWVALVASPRAGALQFCGRATDADGRPLAGVRVHAQDSPYDSYTAGGDASTRWDGIYSLTPERPGTYWISFSPANPNLADGWYDPKETGHWAPEARTGIDTAPRGLAGVDITLPVMIKARGSIHSSDGWPLADLSVAARLLAWSALESRATPSAAGDFELTLRPESQYKIEIRDAGGSTRGWYASGADGGARAGESSATILTTGTVDFAGIDITIGSGPRISGVVQSANGPLAGISVRATNTATSAVAGPVVTGPDGRFSIWVDGAATYNVLVADESAAYLRGAYAATEPGHWTETEFRATPISVGLADVSGIVIEPLRAIRISGTITLADRGIDLVGVHLHDGVGVASRLWAEADAQGAFTFLVHPGRTYTLSISGPPSFGGPIWYSSTAPGHWVDIQSDATLLHIADADITDIDMTPPAPPWP